MSYEMTMNTKYVKEFLEIAPAILHHNVGDFGCGEGIIAVELRKKRECTIIGFDIIPERVTKAQFFAIKNGFKDVKFSVSDFHYKINAFDNTFDSGYSLHTIEHMNKPHRMLREIQRVMKNNAEFIWMLPIDHAFDSPFHDPEEPEDHKQYWSIESFKEFIKPFFNIEKAYPSPTDGGNMVIICKVRK